MKRRHQRWVATGFVFVVGIGAVCSYYYGVSTQRMLMFGWLAPLLAAGYAAGINVWAGGPLDWNNDKAIEERAAGR